MEDALATAALPVRSWPVVARPRLGRMSFQLASLALLAVPIGYAIFLFSSQDDGAFVVLFAFLLLPIVVFPAIAIVCHECAARIIELGPEGLHAGFPEPRRIHISYECVVEYREYATVVEVEHVTLAAPSLWRLARSRMQQDHWDQFTSEFKHRIRTMNPATRIYDAHSGPPPAPTRN